MFSSALRKVVNTNTQDCASPVVPKFHVKSRINFFETLVSCKEKENTSTLKRVESNKENVKKPTLNYAYNKSTPNKITQSADTSSNPFGIALRPTFNRKLNEVKEHEKLEKKIDVLERTIKTAKQKQRESMRLGDLKQVNKLSRRIEKNEAKLLKLAQIDEMMIHIIEDREQKQHSPHLLELINQIDSEPIPVKEKQPTDELLKKEEPWESLPEISEQTLIEASTTEHHEQVNLVLKQIYEEKTEIESELENFIENNKNYLGKESRSSDSKAENSETDQTTEADQESGFGSELNSGEEDSIDIDETNLHADLWGGIVKVVAEKCCNDGNANADWSTFSCYSVCDNRTHSELVFNDDKDSINQDWQEKDSDFITVRPSYITELSDCIEQKNEELILIKADLAAHRAKLYAALHQQAQNEYKLRMFETKFLQYQTEKLRFESKIETQRKKIMDHEQSELRREIEFLREETKIRKNVVEELRRKIRTSLSTLSTEQQIDLRNELIVEDPFIECSIRLLSSSDTPIEQISIIEQRLSTLSSHKEVRVSAVVKPKKFAFSNFFIYWNFFFPSFLLIFTLFFLISCRN